MGWWGYGIMDGDTPMDIEADWDQFAEENGGKVDVEHFINLFENPYRFYGNIFETVVAALAMRDGAELSADIRSALIDDVTDAVDSDLEDWSRPDERREALSVLLRELEAYDGTPANIKRTGLMEVIKEKLKNS